jgi:hypothetical protein
MNMTGRLKVVRSKAVCLLSEPESVQRKKEEESQRPAITPAVMVGSSCMLYGERSIFSTFLPPRVFGLVVEIR